MILGIASTSPILRNETGKKNLAKVKITIKLLTPTITRRPANSISVEGLNNKKDITIADSP